LAGIFSLFDISLSSTPRGIGCAEASDAYHTKNLLKKANPIQSRNAPRATLLRVSPH